MSLAPADPPHSTLRFNNESNSLVRADSPSVSQSPSINFDRHLEYQQGPLSIDPLHLIYIAIFFSDL